VLAESHKVGRKIPNLELPWSRIDTLITDTGLAAELKQQIEQQGVQVICVPELV
jgi:DeoR/GlpR family transcriptional regulator of sugar metabolism